MEDRLIELLESINNNLHDIASELSNISNAIGSPNPTKWLDEELMRELKNQMSK